VSLIVRDEQSRSAPGEKEIADPRQSITSERRRRVDANELLAIALGGALGGLARVGLAEAVPARPGSWPWATFGVNIVGALLIGYFATRLQERLPVSTLRRPLLSTGLCGALTTFSTVQIELLRMADRHAWGLAAGYLGASVIGGYTTVFAASAMVRRVRALA
jgi:fluoride exporter